MSEGTHSYFDWQISTLMLAYDLVEPLDRDDSEGHGKRDEAVREELRKMVHDTLPKSYFENPQKDFSPAIVSMLTRATLRRAAEIAGIL